MSAVHRPNSKRACELWDAVRRFGEVLMPILRELGVDGDAETYPTHSLASA